MPSKVRTQSCGPSGVTTLVPQPQAHLLHAGAVAAGLDLARSAGQRQFGHEPVGVRRPVDTDRQGKVGIRRERAVVVRIVRRAGRDDEPEIDRARTDREVVEPACLVEHRFARERQRQCPKGELGGEIEPALAAAAQLGEVDARLLAASRHGREALHHDVAEGHGLEAEGAQCRELALQRGDSSVGHLRHRAALGAWARRRLSREEGGEVDIGALDLQPAEFEAATDERQETDAEADAIDGRRRLRLVGS